MQLVPITFAATKPGGSAILVVSLVVTEKEMDDAVPGNGSAAVAHARGTDTQYVALTDC